VTTDPYTVPELVMQQYNSLKLDQLVKTTESMCNYQQFLSSKIWQK